MMMVLIIAQMLESRTLHGGGAYGPDRRDHKAQTQMPSSRAVQSEVALTNSYIILSTNSEQSYMNHVIVLLRLSTNSEQKC